MRLRIFAVIAMAGFVGCSFGQNVAQTATNHVNLPGPTALIDTEAAPTVKPTQTLTETPEQIGLARYFVQPQLPNIQVDLVYHARDVQLSREAFGYDLSSGDIVSLVEAVSTNLQAFIQPDAWSPSGEGFLLVEEADSDATGGNEYYRVYLVDLADNLVSPLFDFFYDGIWAGEIYITTTVWWSPAEDKIAYSGVNSEVAYIAVYSLAEQTIHHVFEIDYPGTGGIRLIGWSADGNSLFFISNFGRDNETYMGEDGIYRLDLLTGKAEEIFYDEHMGILDARLSSQDSNLIALEANGPELDYFAWKLFLLDISADQMTELVPEEQWPIHFEFSPDGQFLAYSQLHQDEFDLCIRDNSSMQSLCGLPEEFLHEQGDLIAILNWLPNSREMSLLFFMPDASCYRTAVVDLDRELQEAISDGLAPLCNLEVLSWNPAFSD